MSRTPPTFYVFHGDDEFSRKAEVKVMRSRMGEQADLNTEVMDGKTVRAADVISAVSSMPFLADKRLVIVEGMLSWLSRKGAGKTGKAELEYLTDKLPHLPETARLIFSEAETLGDSNAVLKLAREDPYGYAKTFNPPRDPVNWIVRQVEHYGGKIGSQAAGALAAVIGDDFRRADSECLKLVIFVGGDRAITEDDIIQLTSYIAEAKIWDMVDALGERNGPKAITFMHRLLENSEPLALLGMINRQFRLLIQVREVLDAGGMPSDLMKLADIKSSYTAQKLAQQARNFTISQLESVHRYLLDVDFSIKSGQVKDDVLALDLLVATLAA
jgi:DNA polymerase-3 subunit delta